MTEKKADKKETEPERAKNYFEVLNSLNVQEKIEKKNGLSYLSWAYAWGELKKLHPTAAYRVYETESSCIYFTDGRTCWVKTSVTVNDIEHIEYLPVMDFKNQSISKDKITSFDVNKAIQRSLTKAIARHGLGLYIYAGEDLPEDEKEAQDKAAKEALAGSVRDGVDTEQRDQMYDQGLKSLDAAPDLEKLKSEWGKIAKGRKVFTEEQWKDLEAKKDERKFEIENKPPF
jgi:hypothetical protein